MNRIDLTAVAKLAINMAHADGILDPHEVEVLANGFSHFGLGSADARQIVFAAGFCSDADAEAVVSELSEKDKSFVSAWLLSVIVADGKVADSEKSYYRHLVSACGLLNVSLDDFGANTPRLEKIVCYRVVCGSGDYDFKSEQEAKEAVQELSGFDTRPAVLSMFKIRKVEVAAHHKFWSLQSLRDKLRREDEEWLNQPMFIANNLDTYLQGIIRKQNEYR